MHLRFCLHFCAHITILCLFLAGATTVQAQTDIPEGSYIKGTSLSSVYLLHEGKRLPFLHETIFFTHTSSFDDVIVIPDNELAAYPLGTPVAPNVGSLLKIQSLPQVYLVSGTVSAPVLHWIASEDVARDLYGAEWASLVIDIPPTMWSIFSFGDAIEQADDAPQEQVLYGFWGLNGFLSQEGLADVQQRFGTTIFQVASEHPLYTVNTLLPLVEDSGMKVTLRLTAWNDNLATNGNFDISKWKEDLLVWKNSGVQTYIDNGILVGHMMLDDILTFTGANPTAAEIDEMARYSKELLPGLMTFVRNRATTMPVPADGTYDYLDAVVNQYEVLHGNVETYAVTEAAAAKKLNVSIINGLDIADGGDGSSGQAGWRKGFYAMSDVEIMRYSEVLLHVPGVNMFLMWEYDKEEPWSDGTIGSDYLDQPQFEDAILGISDLRISF